MQGDGILQTIAEVSVAYAGFSGVVVAFGRRVRPGGGTHDAHAFKAMLASSFQALFFAVLPFLLAASGIAEPELWRLGSGLMAAGILVGAAVDVGYFRSVDRSNWTGFDRVLQFLIPLLGVAALIALVFNLFGAVERPFAPYLAGLVYLLAFSSLMFVRLLLAPETDAGTTA